MKKMYREKCVGVFKCTMQIIVDSEITVEKGIVGIVVETMIAVATVEGNHVL